MASRRYDMYVALCLFIVMQHVVAMDQPNNGWWRESWPGLRLLLSAFPQEEQPRVAEKLLLRLALYRDTPEQQMRIEEEALVKWNLSCVLAATLAALQSEERWAEVVLAASRMFSNPPYNMALADDVLCNRVGCLYSVHSDSIVAALAAQLSPPAGEMMRPLLTVCKRQISDMEDFFIKQKRIFKLLHKGVERWRNGGVSDDEQPDDVPLKRFRDDDERTEPSAKRSRAE